MLDVFLLRLRGNSVRKRIILLSLDIAIILLATLIAVLLRDNFETRLIQWEGVAPYLKATVVSAVPVLLLFGLDRALRVALNVYSEKAS